MARLFVTCLGLETDLVDCTMRAELLKKFADSMGVVETVWEPVAGWKVPASYAAELGAGFDSPKFTTVVVVFKHHHPASYLVPVKHKAVSIEDYYRIAGLRCFNINPGVLDAKGVWLASHKDSEHRIFAGEGVWIEQQMVWRGNQLMVHPWTFQELTMGDRMELMQQLGSTIK